MTKQKLLIVLHIMETIVGMLSEPSTRMTGALNYQIQTEALCLPPGRNLTNISMKIILE